MSIFSSAYWKSAVGEFRSVKKLCFAGILIAFSVILHFFSIPLIPGVIVVQFTFLAEMLAGAICGPLLGLVYGAAADTISFLTNSQGNAFNPLYVLAVMANTLIYALFFYKKTLTIKRIALSKLSVNVLCNALFGTWLLVISLGFQFDVYFAIRLVKNLLLLPLEIFLFSLFFGLVVRPLAMQKAIAQDTFSPISRRNLVLFIIISVLCTAFAISAIVYPEFYENLIANIKAFFA